MRKNTTILLRRSVELICLILVFGMLICSFSTFAEETEEPVVVEKPQVEKSEDAVVQPAPEKKTAEKVVEKTNTDKVADGYAIQLLASDKKINGSDSQFKSYRGKVACYIGGGKLKYKYCYGNFATRAEAQRKLSEVRRTFKDAFVIHYNGDKIVK